MILTISSDWHLSNKMYKPENRIDDFYGEQNRKVEFIFDYSTDVILLGGDMFDTPHISYNRLSNLIEFIRESGKRIITVYGQHDLRYHTSKENTPLYALSVALPEQVFVAGVKPMYTNYGKGEGINIYGASFGDEIPSIEDPSQFNVLLIHDMIIDDKLWEGQTNYKSGLRILMEYPFDLIVSGDNHQTFMFEAQNRYLINSGSLMRLKTNQVNHIPIMFTLDTTSKKIREYPIPCSPSDKIFDLVQYEEDKERDEKMKAFIKILTETPSQELGLDFLNKLRAYISENDVSEDLKSIIREILQSVGEDL